MTKKLAVAVIHGVGNQGGVRPTDSAVPTFSSPLHKRIRKELGDKKFDRTIAWREIFWADILLPRQMGYMDAIRSQVNYDTIREFILCNISDGASYKKTDTGPEDAYRLINQRVGDTVAELNADTDDHAPLIILAHSFGGHIISNYIWDMQAGHTQASTPIQQMKTMGGLITFGTNIPLFLFAYAPDKVRPIAYPGTSLPKETRTQPWWLNFYDRDDVLGYPLREAAPRYGEMVQGGEIQETPIMVGGLFSGWNPASHNKYWTDRNFYRPTAKFIKKFL